MTRKLHLGHIDSDLNMAMSTELPFRHTDSDVDIAINNRFKYDHRQKVTLKTRKR